MGPYLFLQPLKLVTSNLAQILGLRCRLPKQLLDLNLAGVWARGIPQTFWDSIPVLISANVTSKDFKFGTQLGFAE